MVTIFEKCKKILPLKFVNRVPLFSKQAKLPELFKLDVIRKGLGEVISPTSVVLLQELERFNKLIGRMSVSLSSLQKVGCGGGREGGRTAYIYTYGIPQKEHSSNKKNLPRFFIRNVPHFYGLPLGLCGKRIAVLFAKRSAIFANVTRFGETRRIFTGKVPQSLDCGALQDGALSGIA